MKHDADHNIEEFQLSTVAEQETPVRSEAIALRLRACFSAMPDVRLAYFQPTPDHEQLCVSGIDHARVLLHFARSVSDEHIAKRLTKLRRQFAALLPGDGEFLDIERLDYRDACEVAFNAQLVHGTLEAVERDRLFRYNVFLEWNAGKKLSGVKQDTPPTLLPSLDRSLRVLGVERFITPIYRHLKLIGGHLRELQRLDAQSLADFSSDSTAKALAESYMLKAIQSTILITMSVMHRTMRLSARDYRDLFLLMPVYGMTHRDRAAKLAHCAEIRDRLMFQYDEVTAVEVFQQAREVCEALQDFKAFMLEWLFEHYYGATGELIQSE
ncbi:MAG TPA: HepT-like ribonuclease domain-containing protein [Armatimonadota bacterium]|jgi:uncharacterized protein YutE (UPF0331/DUF86 family)